ncbi:hypothetical protein TNCV_2922951 [Trichonephila clavipes]|nr:hypothetical protein TNCV_2922951 [Trichonephila clavipes]
MEMEERSDDSHFHDKQQLWHLTRVCDGYLGPELMKVDDVTAEKYYQETAFDTFVAQLCRYHVMHVCVFGIRKVSHRRYQQNCEWHFSLLRCIMLNGGYTSTAP